MTLRIIPFERAQARPGLRDRLAAGGAALAIHGAALTALMLIPPYAPDRFENTGRIIDIQFYTGEDPAPLPTAAETDADDDSEVDDEADEDEAPDEPDEEAVQAEPDAPVAAPPVPVSPEDDPPEDILPEPEEPAAQSATPPESADDLPDADTPVTIAPPPASSGEAQAPPSMADIQARAPDPLAMRPEEFMTGNLSAGVQGVAREVFCLSSSDANRAIFPCPDDIDEEDIIGRAVQRLLAMSTSELQFQENLSRVEYELMQLGSDPAVMQRLRIYFDTQRRQALNTPPLLRQMERDGGAATDNLGVSRPITPRRARDPSGEP